MPKDRQFKISCYCLLPDAYCLLDHLVRSVTAPTAESSGRSLRCFQIDHELKLRRLLDGQIGGLCAFQNLIHVVSRGRPDRREVMSVRKKRAVLDPLSAVAGKRQALFKATAAPGERGILH